MSCLCLSFFFGRCCCVSLFFFDRVTNVVRSRDEKLKQIEPFLSLSLFPWHFLENLSAMLSARVRTPAWPASGTNTNRTRTRAETNRSTDNATTKKKQQAAVVKLAWVSADGERRAEVDALVGDNLLAAATRAAEACGDEAPPAGCFSGSCGVCELTLRRLGGEGGGPDGAPAVVRTCITAVPADYESIEVQPLPDDAIWGVDAWDT